MLAVSSPERAAAYSLSQAYRSADAGTAAPFEYVALALAIIRDGLIWGGLPGIQVAIGIALIVGAGFHVFLRGRRR